MKRSLALFVLFTLVACGKRGDPKPPVPVIPAATTDLVVTQLADRVLLSWSYPAHSTAGRSLASVRRISIYRYEESLSTAPGANAPTIAEAQFTRLSKKVESIEKANLAGASVGSRLLFSDTPPLRSSDGGPVRLTYAVVTEGEEARSQPSNLAVIVPLAASVPPLDVKATVSSPAKTGASFAAIQNQEDAPPCSTCGSIMVRSGACYKCTNCGTTSGCA